MAQKIAETNCYYHKGANLAPTCIVHHQKFIGIETTRSWGVTSEPSAPPSKDQIGHIISIFQSFYSGYPTLPWVSGLLNPPPLTDRVEEDENFLK